MKLIGEREQILGPLQAVIGVVERRQTMPILANVLLAAKNGRLSVTATDLEVELVAGAEVTVQQAGEITVSVPLIGSRVEDVVGKVIRIALDAEYAVGLRRLAAR